MRAEELIEGSEDVWLVVISQRSGRLEHACRLNGERSASRRRHSAATHSLRESEPVGNVISQAEREPPEISVQYMSKAEQHQRERIRTCANNKCRRVRDHASSSALSRPDTRQNATFEDEEPPALPTEAEMLFRRSSPDALCRLRNIKDNIDAR